MSVQRKRNIAGYYDDHGQFRPIRKPSYVGTPKRKAKAADKKKYSRAKAGDLGKKRQALALEDVFDREIRLQREDAEKAKRFQESEMRQAERDAFGTRDDGRLSHTLMQFVRSSGGIRRTYRHGGRKAHGNRSSYDAGEINRLSYKQTGKRGLTTDKGGMTMDRMFQAARESGYDVADMDDMMSRIEDEAAGGTPTYATHGYLDYRDNPKNMRSDLYVNQLGTRKFAVYLKTYQLKVFQTKAAAQAYIASLRKRAKKRNPPSASRLAKAAISAFDNDLDLDLDVRDIHRLRTGEKQLRRRKSNAVVSKRKRPVRKTNARKYSKEEVRKAYEKLLRRSVKPNDPAFLKFYAALVASPKKNPLDPLSAFANATVGIASALQIKEHINRPARRKAKKSGTTTAKARKRAKNPTTLPATATQVHEREFDRLLAQIEEGNFQKIRSAKMKGLLAGYSTREVEHLINRSRLAARLKLNPSPNLIAESTKLVKNGMFNRILARHKAASAFRKELRLEAALEKARAKKEKAKAASKRNPVRVKLYKFYAGQALATRSIGDHDIIYRAKVISRTPKMVTFEDGGKVKRAKIYRNGDTEYFYPAGRFSMAPTYWAKTDAAKLNPRATNLKKIPHRRTFSMFQGRPATKANALPVSRHAPPRLDQLGDLIELKLTNGQVLTLNPRRFKLCAAGGKLWIAGGKFAKANPAEKANVLNPVAEIAHVVYGTHKPHHGDNNYTHYIHKLGEESGHRPILAIDREGFPVIRGGRYKIEARGIVN